MLTKEEMNEYDFQKLVQITLMDLRIRRTLFENEVASLQQEARTLEREEELEQLDTQIMLITKDYEHYRQFVNKDLIIDIETYYE